MRKIRRDIDKLTRRAGGEPCEVCRAGMPEREMQITFVGLPQKAHAEDASNVAYSDTRSGPCEACGREPLRISMRGLSEAKTLKERGT